MPENPETKVTRRIRRFLVDRGAYFIKISDTFTRGIPDSLIVASGMWMVEFKVDRSKGTLSTRSYKSLGLTGAQDSRIRNICRRCHGGGLVVSDLADGGRLRAWLPVNPNKEGPGYEDYYMLLEGSDNLLRLMGL